MSVIGGEEKMHRHVSLMAEELPSDKPDRKERDSAPDVGIPHLPCCRRSDVDPVPCEGRAADNRDQDKPWQESGRGIEQVEPIPESLL